MLKRAILGLYTLRLRLGPQVTKEEYDIIYLHVFHDS